MVKNLNKKFINLSERFIAGSNMLLSKNRNIFSPNNWPTYYKRAKGCYIWDLNGKKYLDMCVMGVGTNLLGYSDNKIDNSVIRALKQSNMSTLNCPEEVMLAKELLSLHKWAGKVRFARTGADAAAIAVRLSRVFTNKEKVIICGYHGWQDWYLAANINNKKLLNKHLFPNLKIDGIPKEYSKYTYSVNYGDLEKINKILKKDKQIGTIIMEVSRNKKVDIKFLKEIRKITAKNKISLVFDECTSGFRENLGGYHKTININPDIATFGKALGNGYAITAIIGKKKIMESFKHTFISSTFWTERSGYVAALKTISILKKKKPWKEIINKGRLIKKKWLQISKKHSIPIDIYGLDAIPSFSFADKNKNLIYKTFLTQELLKSNILAANMIFVSTAHSAKDLRKYFIRLEKVFKDLSKLNIQQIKRKIDGKICFNSMARMN